MALVIHTRRINRGAARRGMGRGAGMGLGPRRSPSKSRSSTPLSANSRSRSNSRREPSPRPSPVPIERQSEEETDPTEDENPSHNSHSSEKADTVESEPSEDYSPASPSTGSDIGNQALHDRIEMLEGQVVEVIDRCVQLERNQLLAARSWKSKVTDRWTYHRVVARKYFGLITEFLKEWYGRKPPVGSFWHRRPTQQFGAWLEARYFPEDEP